MSELPPNRTHDIHAKLDQIHKDIGKVLSISQNNREDIQRMDTRVGRIEQKFFVLQCVWGIIVASTSFIVAKVRDFI